ncbi:class I SAM-dependent methyltransferase [Acidovorax soli]|uniref:class I SAM-dependent methyltransferase n=1 Tax=Acidovorax TaxID=12916 RepID=UPI0032B25B00
MSTQTHWELVYGTKSPETVSWYAPHLLQSLQYVRTAAGSKQASIIDVGGGESTLVDDLLTDGYGNITVLDLSHTALEVTQQRLGPKAADVAWLAADILEAELPAASVDVWHDRAVFHFLTTDEQRERYVAQVVHALRPGGFAIVGTFGPQGPEKCSGLAVSRYAPQELHGKFGVPFELIESHTEIHTTPWGAPQQFVYCFCRHHAQ